MMSERRGQATAEAGTLCVRRAMSSAASLLQGAAGKSERFLCTNKDRLVEERVSSARHAWSSAGSEPQMPSIVVQAFVDDNDD